MSKNGANLVSELFFSTTEMFFFTMPYLTYILQFPCICSLLPKILSRNAYQFERIVYYVLLILWYNVFGKLLKSLSFYFRRAFQLLSSGLFLPGSLGIIDPCEVHVIVIYVNTLLVSVL